MAKRRKRNPVLVTYADGRTELRKQGSFKRKKERKRDKRTRYERYLASPQWKAKREKVLARDSHSCRQCGCKDHLQVHHLTYERAYQEPLEDLTTLCRSCHKAHHRAS